LMDLINQLVQPYNPAKHRDTAEILI